MNSCPYCGGDLEPKSKHKIVIDIGDDDMNVTKTFPVKDIIYTEDGRPICPPCKYHVQADHSDRNDCKNTFYKILPNGKMETTGQCCCYSKEHE